MPLEYKDDWEQAKRRMRAWWAHDNVGRCGLSVTAPRDGAADVPPPPAAGRPEEKWYGLDYWSELTEWVNARTFFGGEAFPMYQMGYAGVTTHAAFLGCEVELGPDTGWVRPHPDLAGEALDASALRIDERRRGYRYAIDRLRRAARESGGKCIPGVGAFGGTGDTLAWLRGTERLLYDLADRPEEVAAAERHLIGQWCRLYDRFHEITREAAEGSTCWFGLWSPGKFYAPQNDFSYMISPETYERVFLPALLEQLAFLDHAVYHVDGVGAFVHVDLLCELPGLQGLQILPGEGRPGPLHYMPVLKKVQAAGKNLHIALRPEEISSALRELSARGLFISTACRTEREARDLLRNAERWSTDRVIPAGRRECPPSRRPPRR